MTQHLQTMGIVMSPISVQTMIMTVVAVHLQMVKSLAQGASELANHAPGVKHACPNGGLVTSTRHARNVQTEKEMKSVKIAQGLLTTSIVKSVNSATASIQMRIASSAPLDSLSGDNGYCAESNFCIQNDNESGCCSDDAFLMFGSGCLQGHESCAYCSVCEPQLRYSYGRCVSCTSGVGNEMCEECIKHENTTKFNDCQICLFGYGLNTADDCIECSLDNVRNCKFDSDGTEKAELCVEPYTASYDKTECTLACEVDEFQATTFNTGIGAVTSFYCDKCDSSCATCVGASSTDCLTCKNGQYLDADSACVDKSGELATKQLLVLNSGNKAQAETVDQSSDKTVVHQNLLSAIFQAYSESTSYETASVEILLEKGTHYVLPSHAEEFRIKQRESRLVDFTNSKLDLLIKPVSCSSLTISEVSYSDLANYCTDDVQTDTVTIRNKAKAEFELFVPFKLRVENLVFEAIDSVDSELNDEETADFEWQDGNDYPEPTGSRVRGTFDLFPVCKYRSYASLFQFIAPYRDVSSVDEVQTLEIADCKFQNFFYELGSIVRLPEKATTPAPWKLSITGSTFDKMSFCGSIVANDFPQFSNTADSDLV
eukprot:CAMPEP_0170509800 /NCGR_PEP_ID=MMETSP0208-20121228/65410_1 /TAXON_ID=197538 /ORGANISM="Strombidium inclinatum, Strain S3" /LENGTH=599 /DNA_ID=CAMNT_0010793195 /DNA_START=552 /DNA_END=2351 /DNA_ORIENTATION=-